MVKSILFGLDRMCTGLITLGALLCGNGVILAFTSKASTSAFEAGLILSSSGATIMIAGAALTVIVHAYTTKGN